MTVAITDISTFSTAEVLSTALASLKEAGQAPPWLTINGLRTLLGGYLLEGEAPVDMYRRVARGAAYRLNKEYLYPQFFDIMWKGWLGLATPVAANMGTERGLPISCYSSFAPDTVHGIMDTIREIGVMSAKGGGTSMYVGDIREKGAPITGGGVSNGVVPWLKIADTAINRISQGNSRRGALATYIDIEHKDLLDYLKVRKPNTPEEYHCQYLHQAVCISDDFMARIFDKDKDAREIWRTVINTRLQTGEPYMLFKDTVNRNRPDCYKGNDLRVVQSNLCNEIYLHTDKDHSLVCCLSSLNLALYDEWKDTNLIELAIYFLDAVMEEFIVKAKAFEGFGRAIRFAEKSRALGLGVIGYHTYLQDRMMPFGSVQAKQFNRDFFSDLRQQADAASAKMAIEYGEPEWCRGYGRRHTHCLAVAPTVSNSVISGEVSAGIEPVTAGFYMKSSAKGAQPRYNQSLRRYLKSIGKQNSETWQLIKDNLGSVANLPFMPDEAKEVFKTAREINQFDIIETAGDRQRYLDQGQSVNLFFTRDADANYINNVHLEAYKQGLYGLYYCRTEAETEIKRVESVSSCPINAPPLDSCSVCEG